MGMFKWLKRELRTGTARERSKSSLGFEQVNSPQSKVNSNLNDLSRDDDYLRKLSKFNEWRSSQVGLKNDQGDKTPNRRTSQADFKVSSEPSTKHMRYSLDNHQHMQYKHLERNEANFTSPQQQTRNKNVENIYITDRSQTEPINRRELARVDVTFNRNQKRTSRKDLFEVVDNVNDDLPQAFYEHENSFPFDDDTYQYIVNKHGEVVEYALPYTERSVDIGRRDLSDIMENESHSDGKENETYSIIPLKPKIDTKNLVTRCGTVTPNDKVAKRLSEVELKTASGTLEKKRKKSMPMEGDDHNREFLDAIEDLVNLGRWSRRQLEPELMKTRGSGSDAKLLDFPMIHISCLYIYDEAFLKQQDGVLEWRKATWCKEDVFIRSSKPELIHLHRTKTAMARDVHVLRNVPHKNIALLMALAYDDDNHIITIMEPFSNTLYQLLHEQTYEVPLNLEKYTNFIHQICSALNFLHNRGYIHTNLSSHCILIDSNVSRAKLSGFELSVPVDWDYKQYYPNPNGLSRSNSSNKEIRRRSQKILNQQEDAVDCNKNFTNEGDAWDFCVWGEEQKLTDRTVLANYQWQAPELFDNFNTIEVVRPCVGSDVYSLCMVLLECCTVTVPWKRVSLQELAAKYKSMEFVSIPEKVETSYTDLIIRGTQLDPKIRILTVVDFMQTLETIDNGKTTITENFGSHSRLKNILSRETLQSNIDDCVDKTHKEKQSNMQNYYTELNANKIEFSADEVKRMTCSDFLLELDEETKKLSPRIDHTNTTEYHSVNDKSYLEHNNTSRSSKLLLNITPKFYTPLQIQSPQAVADLSVINGNNGKSQDSVYSFDIDEFELPETPIARNTKIRKNAWLSDQKKMSSQSFNGTYDIRRRGDAVDNVRSNKTFTNVDDVYEEIGRLKVDVNKTFDKILEVQESPGSKYTSTPESENIRASRRRERLSKINSVKTKLNDILAKGNNYPSTLSSTSYCYDSSQREKLHASPVKPASHSRDSSFAVQNWTPSRFKLTNFVNVSPPYNADAIKPANHHDECNTLPREKCTKSLELQTAVEEVSQNQLELKKIELQKAIDHFENSLWKTEKNKCERKAAVNDKNLVNSSTQTPRKELIISDMEKTHSCDKIDTECQTMENYLKIYERPTVENYDANNHQVKQHQEVINLNCKIICDAGKVTLSCDKESVCSDKKIQTVQIESESNHRPIDDDTKDDILKHSADFNEKLFIEEPKISETKDFDEIQNSRERQSFNDSYLPVTDFSRYTTLPNKISTRIIVTPERGYFSQICRKEGSTSSKKGRRVSVLEIAKIFETRSRDCAKSLRNERLSMDSALARGRRFTIDKDGADSREDEFFENMKNSEMAQEFDQSFIYNNALEEGDDVDGVGKICSQCGSNVDANVDPVKDCSSPRRLTLGPELAEMCASLLTDQFLDLETRFLLNSAYDLTQSSNSLRRCQAFAAIQDARSIEDLYIDDEFTSEEQLGSHMQLSSCQEVNTSSAASSLTDGYDIYYRESDFYPAVNLEEFPLLSIDLERNEDGFDECGQEVLESGFVRESIGNNFQPCLTQITEEEQSDLESGGGGNVRTGEKNVMESSL